MQNEAEWKEITALLAQKRDVLKEVYDFSKDKSFKVREEDVEAFSLYYEKRQEYFDLLIRIEERLNKASHQKILKENPSDVRFKDIKAEIKLLAGNILVIDKKNQMIMKKLNVLLAQNMKAVQEGKKVSVKYNDLESLYSRQSSFDSKM